MVAAVKGVLGTLKAEQIFPCLGKEEAFVTMEEYWVISYVATGHQFEDSTCEDAFWLPVFSSREKAFRFLKNRGFKKPGRDFRCRLYSWQKLVEIFGSEYSFVTIDDCGLEYTPVLAVPLV